MLDSEFGVIDALRWRHNDHAGVSNHQPHGCLLNRLFRRKSKKTSKLRVTGLCAGNSPGTGEFPAQMASYAENVSIWWRHHGICMLACLTQCGLVSAYGSIMSLHGNDFISLPLCTGNPPVVGGFPTQRSCDAELWCFLWYIGKGRDCVDGKWQYNVLSWMKYCMSDKNSMHYEKW